MALRNCPERNSPECNNPEIFSGYFGFYSLAVDANSHSHFLPSPSYARGGVKWPLPLPQLSQLATTVSWYIKMNQGHPRSRLFLTL
jgi:hypothetical protein